ncbi:MAG: hypothetical protein M1833_000163 [Piccolia ochrophora]|nr:MAG: hypothetical protein M1833_000163 [Piccolia ochrophora]
MTAPSHQLHLLRAVLRECTYLPDPAARSYCRRGRLVQHGADARKSLFLLRRANQSDPDALLKVLSHTYGRTGKRKHQLLAPLLEPVTPSSHAGVEEVSRRSKDDKIIKLKWQMSPQLKALAQAQKDYSEPKKVGKNIKRTVLKIPAVNAWMKPMPGKRVENSEKRFSQGLLARMLPPLPEKEWDRLANLIKGTLKWEGPVKRRTWARPASERIQTLPRVETSDHDQNRGDRDGRSDLDSTLLTVENLKQSARPPKGPKVHSRDSQRDKVPTPRFMRRRWMEVFALCPVMRWDGKTWRVEWGLPHIVRHRRAELGQKVVDPAMFEGVDEQGHVKIPFTTVGSKRERRELKENSDV